MWGKGPDWNGIWGVVKRQRRQAGRAGPAGWLVGWTGSGNKNHPCGAERSSVSAFTPLTINKDLHFLRMDRHSEIHTPRCAHRLLYCGFGALFSFSWPAGRGALGHLLDESGRWNSRNLTWDLFTKHISSPYAQHTLSTPRLKEGRVKAEREHAYLQCW